MDLFLQASVTHLALQLNSEIVVEILSHVLKSEVPAAVFLDCVAVGMAYAFSDDSTCSKLPKAYT